jgi:microcystin-dependent protein
MSQPFMGEVKIISWNYSPKGWAYCNGQFLPINQNQALFSLLGTMYGGNGQTTFALPDFRGRVPAHIGSGLTQGQAGGQEFHTLTQSEMPSHNHFVSCAPTVDGDAFSPTGAVFAKNGSQPYQSSFTSLTTLAPATVSNVGGSQPHENRQPYLVLGFIIALQGIFPSQN